MSGFEIAGVALAGPAVFRQLLTLCVSGYGVFKDAKGVGKGIHRLWHQLNVTQVRLEDWVQELSIRGGDLATILGQKSLRYQLVLETLALIASVFAEVDQLDSKYGISSIDADKSVKEIQSTDKMSQHRKWAFRGVRESLLSPWQVSMSRSRSPSPTSKGITSQASSVTSKREILSACDIPSTISDWNSIMTYSNQGDLDIEAHELGHRIVEIESIAKRYQQTLPTLRKCEWVFSSHERLQLLIDDLQKYIGMLETLTAGPFKAITENRVPFHEFQAPIKLPFPQLSTFTGREEILTSMVELLNPLIQEKGRPSRRTVVLHGMGGIGKSQVALEYVYRNKERYSSVYWIDATNSDIINASGRQILETLISHYATRYPRSPEFARIATDLGIPGQIDNAGQLIDGSAAKSPWQVVRRWLAKDGNIGWCLVVDGINDQAVDRIVEILPPSAFGHVIVTSRMMTVTCDHLIDVPVMDKESGIKLLLGSKLENAAPDEKSAAETIAEMLGYLPLALSQVLAYVVTRVIAFVEYLQRLREDLSQMISRPFPLYTDGVYSCWKLSVDALMESNPHAITLLRLCSFLSSDGMSVELLHRGLQSMDWLNNDKHQLGDAIDDLVRYTLLKRKSSSTSYGRNGSLWMHPLVRLWARDSSCEGRSVILARRREHLDQIHREGAKNAVRMIGNAVDVDYRTRGTDEYIFERENMAHLNICFTRYIPEHIIGHDIMDEGLISALQNLGRLKHYWGDNFLAVSLMKESIRMYEKLLREKPAIEAALLLAKQQMAFTCVYANVSDSGLPDMETFLKQTALRQGELLGELHQDTLATVSVYASFLQNAGHFTEALELYQKCTEGIKKGMAPSNRTNIYTIHNIGALYFDLQEYDKALEYYERSYELVLQHIGENHGESLKALGNIAYLKQLLGDFKGARECLRRLVQGYEATFGLAHSGTLDRLARLREVCLDMGQFDEALQVTERLLKGWRILYNEEHVSRDEWLQEIEDKRTALGPDG